MNDFDIGKDLQDAYNEGYKDGLIDLANKYKLDERGGSEMKYELGDRVKIRKHWKTRNQLEQINKLGIDDLENYLMSDDMVGDCIKLLRHAKEPIDEIGFIAGIRQIKTEYRLTYSDGNECTEGHIYQEDSKHEQIYLVATRMNCFRKVSFEDIEYVGGN